jgi:2,6-dihydroxypyridine 3-monooxygenase
VRSYTGTRAAVVGGSIGGLTAALLLRELGFTVDVWERTPTQLDNRGGGIVLQPITGRWFDERSTRQVTDLCTTTHHVRYLGADNSVVHDEETLWRYSSWGSLYRALLADFGAQRYHLGEFCAGFDQDGAEVQLRFTSGRVEHADLVVFADGISSTARRRLFPQVRREYSGYVGWRGTVPEDRVSRRTWELVEDSLTYGVADSTHMVLYPIPGVEGEVQKGQRLLNYVWYRNVPAGAAWEELATDVSGYLGEVSIHPGRVQQRFVDEMRETAGRVLPPAMAEVVQLTEQPYLQTVFDVRVPAMAQGRVAVIGDAAFAARPHAAAGTAKAADDAWTLYDHLAAGHGDIPTTLKGWEPAQLELGNQLIDRVSAMGTRSQLTNTWTPGDPDLRFGLYAAGV